MSLQDQLDIKFQLRLEDIIHLNKAELGRGSYGRVFTVQYLGSSQLRCQRDTLDPN